LSHTNIIRDAGFATHEDGAVLSDGRVSSTDDPWKMVRKRVDGIQMHCRTVYEPGSLLVVDDSMIGWTGAATIHMTCLPNKPTSRGVCLKILADGNTRVMLAIDFVECATKQAQKQYADEGKAAAVILGLTEHWHNQMPRTILMDSWFASMPTVVSLLKRGFHSIGNVKTQTKYFRKKELWADAIQGKGAHERNDHAYRQLSLSVNCKQARFVGAFHMAKRQMTLLSTAGSSKEAPVAKCRRVYMTEDGDLVQWQGRLQRPDIHALYWTYFNAIDFNNKIALGPHRDWAASPNKLPSKIWPSTMAISLANAHLVCLKKHKLTTEEYSHFQGGHR
jgi:hypothetical protein